MKKSINWIVFVFMLFLLGLGQWGISLSESPDSITTMTGTISSIAIGNSKYGALHIRENTRVNFVLLGTMLKGDRYHLPFKQGDKVELTVQTNDIRRALKNDRPNAEVEVVGLRLADGTTIIDAQKTMVIFKGVFQIMVSTAYIYFGILLILFGQLNLRK